MRLSDACVKIGSGAKPRGGEAVYQDEGVAFIRSQNIYNDRFTTSGLTFISEKHAKELAGVTVQAGDVLVNITGDSVARVNRAPTNIIPARVNQHVAIVRSNPDVLDARYLHYWFVSSSTQEHLLALATAGATRNALTKGMLERLEVPLPSMPEQLRIAKILGDLDDKIEVNRRMAATLEEMARATFRAWFVDFLPVRAKASARAEGRDPERAAMAALSGRSDADLDALGAETLASLAATAALFPDEWDGPLPKGWTEGTLDGLARMVTTSVQPSREPDAIFEHYSIPAYDDGNGPAMDRGDSIKSGKYAVHRDAVLVSKLNPNTPRVWMPNVRADRAISSTEFMQFVPHDPKARAFLYLLMQSEEMQEAVLMRVTGSTGSRQRAQPGQIATLPVVLPLSALILRFCEVVSPQLALAAHWGDERAVLSNLRDTLLPKLLDGSLSVLRDHVGASA